MTWTIGVYNNKGGTGKSTISCCIAYQAAVDGQRTLLLDLDDQMDSAGWLLAGQVAKGKIETRHMYETAIPALSVIVVSRREDIPRLTRFDVVVLDGRPTGRVGGAILGLADILVMPFTDRTGRKNAVEMATLAQCPVVYFMNQQSPPPSRRAAKKVKNRRLIGFDRALRGKRWGKASRNLYREIKSLFEENK